jgi:hypothetical protein
MLQEFTRRALLGMTLLFSLPTPETHAQAAAEIQVEFSNGTRGIKPSDIQHADLTQRNRWGGALVVLKNGERGYSSERNISTLPGSIPIYTPNSRPSAAVPRAILVEEAKIVGAVATPGHGSSFPPELRARVMGEQASNLGRAGGTGYGHIDRQATARLFQNGQWDLRARM